MSIYFTAMATLLPLLSVKSIYHISPSSPPITSHAAVLGALTYFEIFEYPLTFEEIIRFSGLNTISNEQVEEAISTLILEGKVWQYGHFFQTQPQPDWVRQRLEKNTRADQMQAKALRMGRFISHFPYIRAVLISGSMSKHCMSSDSDIDFFLITTPGRLWLARTILVVFKKIFLFNSHKYFCVNYFVDTEHLEIESQNLFTAMECVTLLPVSGSGWYQRFMAANDWARAAYFPNAALRNTTDVPEQPHYSNLQKILEWLFNNPLGAFLDTQSMKATGWFWKRKFKHFDEKRFDSALKSRKYVSKHHPLWFQEKVLNRYAELMKGRISNN